MLTQKADKLLIKLDRQYGLDAIYHVMTPSSIDVITGDITHADTQLAVKVRRAGLNSIDLSELQRAGLGQVDAAWTMRFAYHGDVKSGDMLTVSSFNYEIIDQGASLDDLGLLWTIFTRRRR